MKVYVLDVEYPRGSQEFGWAPEGWDPQWNGDPETDIEFHWPRVHPYLSYSGARKRAALLELFGATVEIHKSDPVSFGICPDGDGMHLTDTPGGERCSGCERYIAEMRRELERETALGMGLREGIDFW